MEDLKIVFLGQLANTRNITCAFKTSRPHEYAFSTDGGLVFVNIELIAETGNFQIKFQEETYFKDMLVLSVIETAPDILIVNVKDLKDLPVIDRKNR